MMALLKIEQSPNLSYLLEIMEDIPELLKDWGIWQKEQRTAGMVKMMGQTFEDGISGKAEIK